MQPYLSPLIPDCYVHCTPAILKTFVIRSFFFKKWLLTHVFGGSQVQKSSCKQACVGFLTFLPWYHIMLSPVFYRPVKGPAGCIAATLIGRIQFFCIICQFHTNTRCFRDQHASIFKAQRFFYHLIFCTV